MDLKVEYVPIKDLIPTEGNPRVHTTEHIVNISKSIRKFGFINPILVDKATNNIIAGHGRYLAAVSLNMDTVPVIFLPDLTPAQVRELIVADNAITDQSKWDLSLLSHMLSGLDDLGYLELPTIDAVASVEMDIDSASDENTGVRKELLQCPACGHINEAKAFKYADSDKGI